MRGEGREEKGGEGKGEGRGRGEVRGEEAFLVMWPRRLSPLNPPENFFSCGTILFIGVGDVAAKSAFPHHVGWSFIQ